MDRRGHGAIDATVVVAVLVPDVDAHGRGIGGVRVDARAHVRGASTRAAARVASRARSGTIRIATSITTGRVVM